MVSNKPGPVVLRSTGRAKNVSSDDDLVGWKLIDSSAIVDELVTLLPPHSTFPAESLEVLNAAKLLLGQLKKAKNEQEDSGKEKKSIRKKTHAGCQQKRRSSSMPMSASNDSRTHKGQPEELQVKGCIVKNDESLELFNNSSDFLWQTQRTEQAQSIIAKGDNPKRIFYGFYKENWKVGARVDLQHNFDSLPGTVTRVHLLNMHDEYDVQLDNGDVVCNVRADSLRTMDVIPEWLQLLLVSIAVILIVIIVIFVVYNYETMFKQLIEARSSRRGRRCADYSDIVF